MSESTYEEASRPRARPRSAYLDPWRNLAKPFVSGGKMTKASAQQIIDATFDWFAEDIEDQDRKLTISHFIGLGVREQTHSLLPFIEKPKASPQQLRLLNEIYSVGEARLRLGQMTPPQVEQNVYPEIDEQISNLRGKKREITKLVRACPSRRRPLQDQLFDC